MALIITLISSSDSPENKGMKQLCNQCLIRSLVSSDLGMTTSSKGFWLFHIPKTSALTDYLCLRVYGGNGWYGARSSTWSSSSLDCEDSAESSAAASAMSSTYDPCWDLRYSYLFLKRCNSIFSSSSRGTTSTPLVSSRIWCITGNWDKSAYWVLWLLIQESRHDLVEDHLYF